VVGLAGILHGQPIGLMLETAISLAVGAHPAGVAAGPPRARAPRRGGRGRGGARRRRRWRCGRGSWRT
jgi:hypothetical protein